MKRLGWVVLFCLMLAGCREPSLLEGLDQQQVNEVVSVLQRHNISAVKVNNGKAGHSVLIKQIDFAAAVDLLTVYSLPSKPRVEIAQMFAADSLVSSPRAEKARLYSALEQRLEQSLVTLEGIVSARVHISYDLESGESGRKPSSVHLSTLAVYERDIDPQLLIGDIKRFLKNSFSSVEYENISVVLSKRSLIQHTPPSVEPRAGDLSWLYGVLVLGVLSALGCAAVLYRQGRRREAGDAVTN
ncbi:MULTISPECIES: EscJ/YscJ/HrcJ family type III secretion inner membrane ring protein [Pseudomonas]|jgi:type III secretion system YscJ/HrcJ family lipoprotein|uniref:EscJ/YscJ/HrcJ family type III secretion inner membrane ring protein n=1 Tax=Pseudomonas TaxID=286 RepID=UPI00099DC7E0|nr:MULTISPECIES: EscJ/YscJ/HrcJ family type III secretion inner membrane ring protein [Pseudomonas]MCK3838836.1 EscJ/YscJ/HrcJ family type III secretion inner membrane ring protein [Pseudomonas sp. NCIMB 10586]OPA97788.1 EscJ/YscJ/HrcJ family type III secretion inner membrane ring protein [Pseudomonas synxantha]VCU67895.1 Lipoprotein PrgK [Pseudomonas synxantha]